jgi:hypothetical protein
MFANVALEDWLRAACLLGALVMLGGWLLHQRRIRNEHWLWKKRRLRRARLMLNSGGTMAVVSVVALLVL